MTASTTGLSTHLSDISMRVSVDNDSRDCTMTMIMSNKSLSMATSRKRAAAATVIISWQTASLKEIHTQSVSVFSQLKIAHFRYWSRKLAYHHTSCILDLSLCPWSCIINDTKPLRGHLTGCRAGNGDQLSSNQAEPGQAIKSAVAYFPSISCATSCRVAL